MLSFFRKRRDDGGFLAALGRDVRGNTLALVAASLIPLTGMVGGGIDISRMYITKTRLQHACDAGALAGRKAMGGGVWTTTTNGTAVAFFDGNYLSDAYGGLNRARSYSESAGKVSGTASVDLPMTLMKVLGKTSVTLAVTCEAEMRLPNTDVMFVLDTTGSMNCVAGDTNCSNNGNVAATGSKIDGLKDAVKCFYETVARLDTNGNCDGSPSGGTGNQVQIRFGFVPYSSNVNVGKLLPSSYFAGTWNYQSRVRNGSAWGDWTTYQYRDSSKNGNCNAQSNNTSTRQYQSNKVTSKNDYYCQDQYRNYIPQWDYKQVATSISALKSGTGWNSTYSFTLPVNDDGSNRTVTWDGCIEERKTVKTTSFDPLPTAAYDLDIDKMPDATDTDTLWGPALEQLIWYRGVTSSLGEVDRSAVTTTTNYYNPNDVACPTEAKKLQAWPDATAFDTYVDSLTASGNTYHDIGLIWGARLLSPTGIFKTENATASGGGKIERHMIFMTDGDATSNACDYNAYGVPYYDRRQTSSSDVGAASDCGSRNQLLIDQINLRLAALCKSIQNKQITLWVVSYGGDTNTDTNNRLKACATSETYYVNATDPTKLKAAFNMIANQITQLRLVN